MSRREIDWSSLRNSGLGRLDERGGWMRAGRMEDEEKGRLLQVIMPYRKG